jgi:hypothetical protein
MRTTAASTLASVRFSPARSSVRCGYRTRCVKTRCRDCWLQIEQSWLSSGLANRTRTLAEVVALARQWLRSYAEH